MCFFLYKLVKSLKLKIVGGDALIAPAVSTVLFIPFTANP